MNLSIVEVDDADCGRIQDGPVKSLTLTGKADEIEKHITEAASHPYNDACADTYVSEKSMEPIFNFFRERLPQPDTDAAYQPID